jgi:hypothetical protein
MTSMMKEITSLKSTRTIPQCSLQCNQLHLSLWNLKLLMSQCGVALQQPNPSGLLWWLSNVTEIMSQ